MTKAKGARHGPDIAAVSRDHVPLHPTLPLVAVADVARPTAVAALAPLLPDVATIIAIVILRLVAVAGTTMNGMRGIVAIGVAVEVRIVSTTGVTVPRGAGSPLGTAINAHPCLLILVIWIARATPVPPVRISSNGPTHLPQLLCHPMPMSKEQHAWQP